MPRPQQRTEPPYLGPLKAGYRPRIEDNYKPSPLQLVRPSGAPAHLEDEEPRKPKDYGPIAAAVRAAREKARMTQAAFAELIGVDARVISEMETGQNIGYEPGARSRRVLEYLGIDPPTSKRGGVRGPKRW